MFTFDCSPLAVQDYVKVYAQLEIWNRLPKQCDTFFWKGLVNRALLVIIFKTCEWIN